MTNAGVAWCLPPVAKQGEQPKLLPLRYWVMIAVLFLHTLILFHRLGGDGGRGFRAVTHLRIARGRADGSPRFA